MRVEERGLRNKLQKRKKGSGSLGEREREGERVWEQGDGERYWQLLGSYIDPQPLSHGLGISYVDIVNILGFTGKMVCCATQHSHCSMKTN